MVEEPRPTTPPKYQVREPPYLHSRFLEQMIEREKQKEEDLRRKEQETEDRRVAVSTYFSLGVYSAVHFTA